MLSIIRSFVYVLIWMSKIKNKTVYTDIHHDFNKFYTNV